MGDRYPIRWLTTVNRISCGEGFWPWFRGTPLKERLVSAVKGADSAGVSTRAFPMISFLALLMRSFIPTHLNIFYSRFKLAEMRSLRISLTFIHEE